MLKKYQIIIFKNRKRYKVLFSSNLKYNIQKKYNKYIRENNITFSKKFSSREPIHFEICMICNHGCKSKKIYKRDDLGRLDLIELEGDSQIIEINDYEIEEKLHDHQLNKRISFDEFIERYTFKKDIYQMYTINNKIVVQKDSNYNLFSLKNIEDSKRFISIIRDYFSKNKIINCLISLDLSTAQRKLIYTDLEKIGYDREFLQKHYTY